MRTEAIYVKEMVVMFLHILVHDVENSRIIQREFVWFGEIVYRHFDIVFLVVLRLHGDLLKKLQPVPNSCTDLRWK